MGSNISRPSKAEAKDASLQNDTTAQASLDAAPRQLQMECEVVVQLVGGLVSRRPQLILIDAAENLSPYAWQVATGVLAGASLTRRQELIASRNRGRSMTSASFIGGRRGSASLNRRTANTIGGVARA